jgi:hypothetical protein
MGFTEDFKLISKRNNYAVCLLITLGYMKGTRKTSN